MQASSVIGLCGGLISIGLIWTCQSASAVPRADGGLFAQHVVEGLPPPPPVVFGQETLPSASPEQFPSPTPALPTDPQTPAPNPAQQYLVIVNGDSPLLLSQVQSVVGNASIQEYNGQRFILAGAFNDPAAAQQHVAALASQGIGAEIVIAETASAAPNSQPAQQANLPDMPPPDLLPATPVPREVEFGQPPSQEQLTNPAPASEVEETIPAEGSSYYVVIPGDSDDLTAITNQVIRLGDSFGIAQLVQADDARGSHVRVGPFSDRGAAHRWSRYFRSFGMDARIYYKR